MKNFIKEEIDKHAILYNTLYFFCDKLKNTYETTFDKMDFVKQIDKIVQNLEFIDVVARYYHLATENREAYECKYQEASYQFVHHFIKKTIEHLSDLKNLRNKKGYDSFKDDLYLTGLVIQIFENHEKLIKMNQNLLYSANEAALKYYDNLFEIENSASEKYSLLILGV